MNIIKLRLFCVYIATLAGIGKLPFAPGTWATYCTLPIVYLISLFSFSLYTHLIIVLCMLFCSYGIIAFALPHFDNNNDPSEIVLDEYMGTLITFIGVPITWKTLVLGFFFFRFFDIVKPFGIKRLEKIAGAAGILADDSLAALYAACLLHLYSWFFV